MRATLPVIMAILALPISAPAAAQDGRHFTVPSQPLAEALAEFARESGVDVIYEGKVVAQLRSHAIDGAFTTPAALRALLEGTGLSARYTGRNAAIIYRIDRAQPHSTAVIAGAPSLRLDMAKVRAPLLIGVAAPSGRDAYGLGVQAEIRAMLQDDRSIARQRFTIEMAVEIDTTGRIGTVEVLRGSGDRTRDEHILKVLRGRHLSRPPPDGLRDPLRFAVTSVRLADRD